MSGKDVVQFTQISDIHLGGDYKGFFPVEENFKQVLDWAPADSYLIITGDLADNNHREHYERIKRDVEAKFNDRYSVLPGNHDDVKVLNEVFAGHTSSFVYRGVPVSLIPTIWDESAGSEFGVGVDFFDDNDMLPGSIVFTHYPVFDTSHKFMNKHALSKSGKQRIRNLMEKTKSSLLFCGHFHDCCKSDITNTVTETHDMGHTEVRNGTEFVQYICPATQCQIDPSSDMFVCSSKKPNGFIINVYVDTPTPQTVIRRSDVGVRRFVI